MTHIGAALSCPINPHAAAAERHARTWARFEGLLPAGPAGNHGLAQVGIGDLVARAYPRASQESLLVCAEWLAWLFAYDDLCDESHLARCPAALDALRVRLCAMLDGLPPVADDPPLVGALARTYARVRRLGSAECCFRIGRLMELHFTAAGWQAENRARGLVPDVETYCRMRRHSGAVYTCFELIDIAADIDLPAEVRDDEVIERLGDLANDVIGWSNDLISLQKEARDGHNLVVVLTRQLGLSQEEARRQAAAMHDNALVEFARLSQRLPPLPRGVDRQAQRYVEGLRACMRGNLAWSLRSARYREEQRSLAAG